MTLHLQAELYKVIETGQAEQPSPYTTHSNSHVHKEALECLSATTAFHVWPGSQASCCPFQYFQLFLFNSQSRHALVKHIFPLRNFLHWVTAQKANIQALHHLLGPLSLPCKDERSPATALLHPIHPSTLGSFICCESPCFLIIRRQFWANEVMRSPPS